MSLQSAADDAYRAFQAAAARQASLSGTASDATRQAASDRLKAAEAASLAANKAVQDSYKKPASTAAFDPAAAADAQTAALLAQQQGFENARKQATRTNIFDTVTSVLKQYGIDLDGTGLSSLVRDWTQQDKSADWIRISLRDTQAYQDRFPAMKELIKRNQFIDEATYIAQEQSYRAVMKAADLPDGFYDKPSDYSSLITGQVSAKELEDRVTSAQTVLDKNTDPAYRSYLAENYGITDGQMLAYVLDGEKAQSLITKQIRSVQMGGAAKKYGFDLIQADAERFSGSLGQQYDVFSQANRTMLEANMGKLSDQANNEQSLANVDQDTSFNKNDILDASLLSNTDKQLASSRRQDREKKRFAGVSAIGQGSLANNSGF